MNTKLFLPVIAISMLFFTACEKDSTTTTTTTASPTPLHANTPTSAYMSYELSGGVYSYFISFFDLSSPQTINKKYFKMQLKYTGVVDSFELVVAPQSINNLATGFPAEIKDHPGFGLVNQWTNPLYTLYTNGGNSYVQDTIVRNPQSNYYNYYLNYQSGPLKGKFPQSNFDNYNVPTGVNGQTNMHFRTAFYFTEGLCYDANNFETFMTIKPISSLYIGAPAYDWQNVNSGLQIELSGANTFYFLDFKNWRYFRWKQFMNNIFSPAQLATTFEGYQSLDKLIKWPDGWGKK